MGVQCMGQWWCFQQWYFVFVCQFVNFGGDVVGVFGYYFGCVYFVFGVFQGDCEVGWVGYYYIGGWYFGYYVVVGYGVLYCVDFVFDVWIVFGFFVFLFDFFVCYVQFVVVILDLVRYVQCCDQDQC